MFKHIKYVMLAGVAAASFAALPVSSSAQEAAIVVRTAPPPLREERVPGPRRGYEWAPGYWAWRHGRYAWVSGSWMRERPGEHWVAHRWVERDGRWEMANGHWERGDARMGGPGMRDRDHDGVPNRYDSRPNDPYRR